MMFEFQGECEALLVISPVVVWTTLRLGVATQCQYQGEAGHAATRREAEYSYLQLNVSLNYPRILTSHVRTIPQIFI